MPHNERGRTVEPHPLTTRLSVADAQEGPTPARVWGDQWLRVSEKVLNGLNHQLTNRVASIEAVVGVLDPEAASDEVLMRALTTEVTRLSALLLLYRLLPAEPTLQSEATRLQDVLPQALELHGYHSDLRNIACQLDEDREAQPVLVRPSALLRSLLVLMAAGAGNAARSRSEHPLLLSYRSEGDEVIIVFEAPSPPGQLIFSGEGSLVHAVRSALSHAHCVVEAEMLQRDGRDVIRYELRLPTLREARRLEREAIAAT